MSQTRVLIGSPVNQHPLILEEFLKSLKNIQQEGCEVGFLFIDDNTMEESKVMLRNFKIDGCKVHIIDTQNTHEYVRTEVTHKWDENLIQKVAGFRNSILAFAKTNDYDYLLMIDSDIMVHPGILKELISQNKDIVSQIIWTSWVPGMRELPQVWLYDYYTLYEIDNIDELSYDEASTRRRAFLDMLKIPGLYKVGGLGACTLISKRALSGGISYDRIPNLSLWGEDRHFCIRAAVLGFDLYVDTHLPSYHIYRMAELEGAKEFKRKNDYRADC